MSDWPDPRDNQNASVRAGRMLLAAFGGMVLIYLVVRLLYGLLT